jgi:hypothetical protein
MCVYAAMKCGAPLAHRELIDMVIAVKEGSAISQLEQVSRTKVRGVLALLKHAQLFVTHGVDGEAVRLHLASNITSFKDLRDRHDTFLNRYILIHHLFIPVNIKGELVWQLEPEIKARRVEELKSLESALIDFFKVIFPQGPRKPPPPAQVPAPGMPMEYGNISMSGGGGGNYSSSNYGVSSSVPSSGYDSPYNDYSSSSPYGGGGGRSANKPQQQMNLLQQSTMNYNNMGNKNNMMMSSGGVGGGNIPRSTNPLAPGVSSGMMSPASGGGGGGGYHQSLGPAGNRFSQGQGQGQYQSQQGQYGMSNNNSNSAIIPPRMINPGSYSRNMMQPQSDSDYAYSPTVSSWQQQQQQQQSFTPRPLTHSLPQQQQSQLSQQQQQFESFTTSSSGTTSFSYLGTVGLEETEFRFSGLQSKVTANGSSGLPGVSAVGVSDVTSSLYAEPEFGNSLPSNNNNNINTIKESPILGPLSQGLGQMNLSDGGSSSFPALNDALKGNEGGLATGSSVTTGEPTTPWSQLFYANNANNAGVSNTTTTGSNSTSDKTSHLTVATSNNNMDNDDNNNDFHNSSVNLDDIISPTDPDPVSSSSHLHQGGGDGNNQEDDPSYYNQF